MKYKFLKIMIVFMLCNIFLVGCGSSNKENISGNNKENGAYLTVTDDLGRQVVLKSKPERIVALSASFLEPLLAVDAKLVGMPSSKTGIPEKAKTLEEVGPVYQINIEQVVALKPDLVIAYKGMQDKFIPILEENNIPVIVIDMKSFESVKDKVKLFGQITGEVEKGNNLVESMDDQVNEVVKKLPQDKKRIAILHSTAQNVTVQLDGSIAGSVAKILGFENVASNSAPLESDHDATPYSLESLVDQNPDAIFVTSMGDMKTIKKSMLENVKNNPAWGTLPAVQKKQLYFLPQNLFLLNPGIHYPEAVKDMAKMIYPTIFTDEK